MRTLMGVVAICALNVTDLVLNTSWSGSVIVPGSGSHSYCETMLPGGRLQNFWIMDLRIGVLQSPVEWQI